MYIANPSACNQSKTDSSPPAYPAVIAVSDPFNYADDAEFTGNIDARRADAAGSPVSGDRDRVLHWASREGLALFEGAPGRKHPLKD